MNFDDFLLFIESKHRNIVRSIIEGPENPRGSSLEFMKNQELEQLRENKLYQELTTEEKERVLEIINNIYNDIAMNEKENLKVEMFKKITEEMVDTYSRKNHDYGDSFGESIKKYGPIAGLVRMSDKWNRLNSLILNNDEARVKDESVVDTLTDLACYAIMLRMELTQEG